MSYFPFLTKSIEYEGPTTRNPFAFQYYNPTEVLGGKTMKDWCRFSICYWHTFTATGSDPFGFSTLDRPWLKEGDALTVAKCKADAAFELFEKLGIDYYTFHDRDIIPEGKTLAESHQLLKEMVPYLKQKQDQTGVKLLWGTANLFSNKRYMNGAGTNPNLDVFAIAGAQIRHAMDATYALGGENFVFWGGREGYMSLLNTDVEKETQHYAALLKMAVKYRDEIGATFQLLIEPKPREPTKHQYDYDAMTVLAFLHQHNLQTHFKVNVEPNHTTLAGHEYEHDIVMAAAGKFLGSIDCNTGDPLVGWDTDQFLMDEAKATAVFQTIVKMGGLAPGGLNFDCKVRRESTDLQDIVLAHLGSMDTFAKGLRNAIQLLEDQTLENLKAKRYASWTSDLGKSIEAGNSSLKDLDEYALKLSEPKLQSAQQELYELHFHRGCRRAN